MRVLKAMLLVSASLFLVSVSWALLTGQFGQVVTAQAQEGISGGIVGLWCNVDGPFGGRVLLADGSVVSFNGFCAQPPMFRDADYSPLPVPVSEIKLWDYRTFVTYSDEIWVVPPPDDPCSPAVWTNLGSPPSLPVNADSESFGGLKGTYQPEGQ